MKQLTFVLFFWGIIIQKETAAQSFQQARVRPPNIILIMADDLGYETLGCNGGTSYVTPHLDKLAADGMRFTSCFSLPLCTPSRVQLMTGKYGFRNYKKFGELDQREKTFANLLKNQGYATCIVGKWQLGGDEKTPNHFGFDEYLLWQLFGKDIGSRYKNPKLVENGIEKNYTANEYGPDLMAQYAVDFIKRNKNRPFLLYYPMMLTHDPFQPVPGMNVYETAPIRGSDTAYFRHMVTYMDRIVGKIAASIEALGLSENTLILFTGDNGTARTVYSMMGSQVIRGNKGFTTAAGTHVPLLAKWSGVIAPGSLNNNLIDFTDIYATFAEALGITNPNDASLDGVSFWKQLQGNKKAGSRDWIFSYYNGLDKGFVKAGYVQNHQFKLYGSGEFYNIQLDPEEKSSISANQLTPMMKKHKNKLQSVLNRMK